MMARRAHADGMNLIALPIAHTVSRRAVTGAHAADQVLPSTPRRRVTRRRRGTS
jgi:hypothetical protein